MAVTTLPENASENVRRFIADHPDFDIHSFDFFDRKAMARLLGGDADAEGGDVEGGEAPRLGAAEPDQELLAELRAYQRVLRICRDAAKAQGLLDLGFNSAIKIASMSALRFVAGTRSVFGDDEAAALDVHARAAHVKTATHHLYGSVKDLVASPFYRSARFNVAAPELQQYFSQIPSYTDLFGNMDYFEVDPGQTIFSPAAYFFDMMRIVDEHITHPNTSPVRTIPAHYTLEERRPDLFKQLQLTPANTFNEIPYLSLANGVLASSIANRGAMDPYQYLAVAPYPFNLPFNLPLLRLRRQLDKMNCPLAALYRAMMVPPRPPADPAVQLLDVERETIGLSVTELSQWIKADADVGAVTKAYGYDIPRQPPPFKGRSIVANRAGSPELVGYQTEFVSQVSVGDQIQVGNEVRKVAEIGDDVSLTTDVSWTTATGVEYVVVQGPRVPPPTPGPGKVSFTANQSVTTGSGTTFTKDFPRGSSISVATSPEEQTRAVTWVTSDTVLTIRLQWTKGVSASPYSIILPPSPPPPFKGRGRIFYEKGETRTLGIDTELRADFGWGDQIQVGNDRRRVFRASSATSLTVTDPWPTSAGAAYTVIPAPTAGTVMDFLPAAGTGAITFIKDSAFVTGSGTAFVREIREGDQIAASGVVRTVARIMSDTQLEVAGKLQEGASDVGFTILKSEGLDAVDVFLARTGLTQDALSQLLRQDLDDTEIEGGGADRFFINDTGETPTIITAAINSDPVNPTQRLLGLTLKRLDRLSRFVRLAQRTGMSFADLQWVMTAIGAKEITSDLVIALGRITRLCAAEGSTVSDITALFYQLKTSGRVDPQNRQDQFDRIYNAPAVLRGADPYAPGSTVPFNPFRAPVQGWTIDGTSAEASLIRDRLRAALRVNDADLTRLAVYVQSLTGAADPKVMPLTLENLGWLHRLRTVAAKLGWAIDDYLTFLGLLYCPEAADYFRPPPRAVPFELDMLEDQLAIARWLADAGYSVGDLEYVVTGRTAPNYAPPYDPAGIPSFLAGLAASAASTCLSAKDFAALQLDDAQSGVLFGLLVEAGIVSARGVIATDGVAYGDVAGMLPIRLTETAFVAGFDSLSFITPTNGITEDQAKEVDTALVKEKILIERTNKTAAVAESFNASTDLAFLRNIFPADTEAKVQSVRAILLMARNGITTLLDIVKQTTALQQTTFVSGLAQFVGAPAATVDAFVPLAVTLADLPRYRVAFLSPASADQPLTRIETFVATMARFAPVARRCSLDPVEIEYATSFLGMAHFNIASWFTPTIRNIRSIHDYAALRDAAGARNDEFIAYFKTPADKDVHQKTAALATATGWDNGDIDDLNSYFWPAASPDDSVCGLQQLAEVFDIERRLRIRTPTLRKLIGTAHLPIETTTGVVDPVAWATYQEAADTALAIVNTAFSGTALRDTNQAIIEVVNGSSRDALVGNVLWWMKARDPGIRDVNDLYTYLLLDVEMGTCFTTSPIAQAISSIQLYMQRCRLMQEPGVLKVNVPEIWWSWMTNYRTWEANRRIFLYPENYIEPSLRQDATPDFRELADDLLQNDATTANVAKPFGTFIDSLNVLGTLAPVGAYQTDRLDQQSGETLNSLFVIGRTRTQPYQFFFRSFDDGVDWQPWTPIELSIGADRLSPIYALGRLFVFWTEFDVGKSSSIKDLKSSTETVDKAIIKYAFYNDGAWTSPQTLMDTVLIDTYPSTYGPIKAGKVHELLQTENSYWQFPYVISTGEGMVGNGLVAVYEDNKAVGGLNTQFIRQIKAGDTISILGRRRVVETVTSDTSLVVTEPWTIRVYLLEYKIIPASQRERFDPFIGTGAVATESVGEKRKVLGSQTRFLSEVAYGDSIQIGDEVHVVVEILSEQELVTDRAWATPMSEAAFNVIPGCQGGERILVCYGPPVDTREAIDFGPPTIKPNDSKDTFIADQDALNLSTYYGLSLAKQYREEKSKVPGYMLLTDAIFLDGKLSRTTNKVLLADFAYSTGDLKPYYRASLLRQSARLVIEPSANLVWDNYWGNNLPGQNDSQRPPGAEGVNLLYNMESAAGSLMTVGNKPGAFVLDNVDEAFLVRADDSADISHISDVLLRSQRPWAAWGPALLDSQIIRTGLCFPYGPVTDVKFAFTRLGTNVMPTLRQRLFVGGVGNLLELSSQYLPELPFNRFYPPPGQYPPENVIPVASTLMDFDGAFGLYFWEIFFHAPFLVADRLQGNGKYREALDWLAYIFNPTQKPDPSEPPDSPSRFWRFRPFREMTQPSLAAVLTDPRQIRRYNDDPFDPDAIAAIRHVAYAKAIVMRYVGVTLDWADALFTQYTRESITQATNLYVFAQNLLGKKPESRGALPLPKPKTFDQLKADYPGIVPQFLIDLENTPFLDPLRDNERYASMPVNDIIAYFSVPENADFMKLWDRVDDRLFKIRNCMNIDGQIVPLALFEPPIDPAQLIRAAAPGGANPLATLVTQGIPYYRFSHLIERAKALCSQLSVLDAALLAALEKKDAEALGMLASQQEAVLLKLTTAVKEQEIVDVEASGEALRQSLASANARLSHYEKLIAEDISPREQASLDAMLDALFYNVLSTMTKTAASIGYTVMQVGSPFAITYGGEQIGQALNAASGVFEIGATIKNFIAQQAQTLASYDRRAEDWQLQKMLAGYEVNQLQDQIAGNNARLEIARRNLQVHQEQIKQGQDKIRFLKDKFTNAALYQWLINQISRVQFQTYTLAYQLAQMAQRAYQFQYGTERSFISFDYWDAAHRGLSSADGLALALNQMEASTLDVARPLEISRTVSLLQTDPVALMTLRSTGECYFDLAERLFDEDFPGHYNRKIKSVSVSIPCVVGPYQNIKATLVQLGNHVVLQAGKGGLDAVRYLLGEPLVTPPAAGTMRTNWRNYQQIVLSKGIDDTGLFALNLDDAQYLPFEGTGAVSSWKLSLPKGTNRIPFEAISDVVLTVNYTAIDGGDAFRSQVAALKPLQAYSGAEYVTSRAMYFDAWQAFFGSFRPGSTSQTLSLPIADFVPPHVDKAKLLGFYILLSADSPVPGKYVSVKFGDTLTADVTLAQTNDNTYRFEESGQLPPMVDKATAQPIRIVFNLDDTPPALLKPDGGLDPAKLKNIELVLYYSGTITL